MADSLTAEVWITCEAKDNLESAVGWEYEGYGAKARDSNVPREVDVWHRGDYV